MDKKETQQFPDSAMENNLKKALAELLVLKLLSEREYYIGDLTATLHERSSGRLSIVFPYSAVYRLQQSGYIAESEKRSAPDSRRRQYYTITPLGRRYFQHQLSTYRSFAAGVDAVLKGEQTESE